MADDENTLSLRVALVLMDDDDMVRTVAAEMLVKLEHLVTTASEGKETVHLHTENMQTDNRFDLVIMT